jgi:hypothetical protein
LPGKCTHRSLAIGKAALEGSHYDVFVLLFNNLWRRRKYPERVFALGCILRLAGLEQRA